MLALAVQMLRKSSSISIKDLGTAGQLAPAPSDSLPRPQEAKAQVARQSITLLISTSQATQCCQFPNASFMPRGLVHALGALPMEFSLLCLTFALPLLHLFNFCAAPFTAR